MSKFTYPRSLASKRYPAFIRTSGILKKFPKPTKAFPKMGLKNSRQSLNSIKGAKDLCPFDKKNLTVHFSSDGNQGLWDLATMSMRKIVSCMRWTNENATSLVGTLLDPYAAIMYITDGTDTKYGKSMLARAVVRFVVDNSNNPHILIEQVYPRGLVDQSKENVAKIFERFIKSRVDLPVTYASEWSNSYNSYKIPNTKPIDEILKFEMKLAGIRNCVPDIDDCEFSSYRDSGIPYADVKKFRHAKKIKSFAVKS